MSNNIKRLYANAMVNGDYIAGSVKCIDHIWFHKIEPTLRIETTGSGEPCLTFEHWKDAKKGIPARYTLCFLTNVVEDGLGYERRGERVYCIYKEYTNETQDNVNWLFPILTKNASMQLDIYLKTVCKDFETLYNEF